MIAHRVWEHIGEWFCLRASHEVTVKFSAAAGVAGNPSRSWWQEATVPLRVGLFRGLLATWLTTRRDRDRE